MVCDPISLCRKRYNNRCKEEEEEEEEAGFSESENQASYIELKHEENLMIPLSFSLSLYLPDRLD